MRDLRIYRWPLKAQRIDGSLIGVLGNFDGVHKGHQFILQKGLALSGVAREQRGLGLISFYPHPAELFGVHVQRLTSLRQQVRLLSEHGCRALYLFRFSKRFAAIPAERFIEILVRDLGLRRLLVGPDASVGAGREAGVQQIEELLRKNRAELEVLPYVEDSGSRISSTGVRLCVQKGDLAGAQRMLGRPFTIEGRVRSGARRGGRLGFPTGNLAPGSYVLPPEGVYVSQVRTTAGQFAGVTNVGCRPTFGGGERVVETHILDYSAGELRGTRIEVEFLSFIRAEMHFAGACELKEQITRDIEYARRILRP